MIGDINEYQEKVFGFRHYEGMNSSLYRNKVKKELHWAAKKERGPEIVKKVFEPRS